MLYLPLPTNVLISKQREQISTALKSVAGRILNEKALAVIQQQQTLKSLAQSISYPIDFAGREMYL